MPFAVDEERMKGKPFMRNGVEVKPILQMDQLAPPVIPIPLYEFPRVVYMHPNESTQVIEHRNDKYELVGEEVIPTEHLTKVIVCSAHASGGPKECKDCQKLLAEALKEGWILEPYIPAPLPKRNSGLYGQRKPVKA